MTKENTVYAPKEVIEELNVLKEKGIYTPSTFLRDVTEGRTIEKIYPIDEIVNWYDKNGTSRHEREGLQVALIGHLFFDTPIKLEREPRYYVQDSVHGNTYFELSSSGEPYQWDFNYHGMPTYSMGMTEEQADLFIQAFGGIKRKVV